MEIDNNFLRFLHHELENDIKKILKNMLIDFDLDEERDGGKDIQMPVGYVQVKDFTIRKFLINQDNELEIEVSNISIYVKVWL